jgi:molybdopterin converting factor small subunit
MTRDGGRRWRRQDRGMPARDAWWTVKRQSMTADRCDPAGLYFGTTSGELWMSRDEGARWSCMARHLPEIYAVETATLDQRLPVRVLIPAPLRSYTRSARVDADGATLPALLDELERRYPGIRFRMIDEQERMRPHIRFFVNGAQTFDLSCALQASDEVLIVQALSGG